MRWKIFAVVYAILGAWSAVDAETYRSPWQIFGFALSVPATTGLVLFAFNRSLLSKRFWKAFALVYAAFSVVALAITARTFHAQVEDGRSIWIVLGAFVFCVALQFFITLALWRYSQSFAASTAR